MFDHILFVLQTCMLGLDDAFCFVSEPLLNDINFQSYFLPMVWFFSSFKNNFSFKL